MDRNEALNIVRNLSYGSRQLSEALETLIPELKENEDERIRKQILDCFRTMKQQGCFPSKHKEQYDSWIAWLEKQGSQNLANSEKTCKVEPKFKVGDWLQYRYANPFFVEEITEQGYVNGNSCLPFEWENEIHLWTIQDAKDGDVLVGNYDNCKKPWIGIFKCISKDRPTTQFDSYCFINSSHHTFITPLSNGFYNPCKGHTIRYALPATKEQRDVLFQKMNEAGYEWDSEKKKLKKIEKK